MPLQRTTLKTLTSLATVTALTIGSAAIAATTPSSGVGDPDFPEYGNSGYDVAHYDIAIDYQTEAKHLDGKTTITATATEQLESFNLDFRQSVSAVTVNGQPAQFRTESVHELVITPQTAIAEGDRFDVTVTYSGSSVVGSGEGYEASGPLRDGGVLFLGEPESAYWWYPSNDHPSDKATFNISITAPDDYTAVSNGRLISTKQQGGKKTWEWREHSPMATYLAFMTVGKYDVKRGFSSTGHPYFTAIATEGVEQEKLDLASADLERLPEVVDWSEGEFGKYPFNDIGGVVPSSEFGFALENQSRPVYSPVFWRRGTPNMNVVVHETAHQWFGNSVSVAQWKDIWLNEGFATWSSWKWAEDKKDDSAFGYSDAGEVAKWVYQVTEDNDGFWGVTIGNPGTGKHFSGAVYYRGAVTLQALRNRVGDEAFSKMLKEWTVRQAYGNATVEEFIALAEEVSGEDLESFFHNWLYTDTRPEATAENGLTADWADPLPEDEAEAGTRSLADKAAELDILHGHKH